MQRKREVTLSHRDFATFRLDKCGMTGKWHWPNRTRHRDKPTDPDMLWLASGAVSFLDEFLAGRTAPKVLECGCGGSTVWFSQRAAEVLSLEHDPDWHQRISTRLEGVANVDLRLVSRPYYGHIDFLLEGHFDVVLIDGRERVECARRAVRVLAETGILLFDDMHRERYADAVPIFARWVRHNFLGVPDKKQKMTTAWSRPR